MIQNEHKGKIRHGFSEKALLGLGALILIFIGGSGTQSSSLLLQGGGFIGLIIGLVVLYISENGLACHGLSAVFSGRYFDYRFYSLCHRRL